MSTRIRYSKDHSGLLVSTRGFTVGDNTYRVSLNETELNFRIYNAVTFETATSGTATNLSSLKISAKKALASLGVSFENETRARGSDENLAA